MVVRELVQSFNDLPEGQQAGIALGYFLIVAVVVANIDHRCSAPHNRANCCQLTQVTAAIGFPPVILLLVLAFFGA